MGNRIIKFEYGFSATDKTIKKVYHLHEIPNIQNICDVWNDLPIKYVRQFTGLHDKNGKEIYEGDIIRDSTDQFQVWIEEGAILIGANDKYCDDFLLNFDVAKMEVIGNIYENPELLTTK